ncbi:MAG: hypothetical protein LBM21_03735 [Coriobacteriales bacterium]|nr:hypothetical protein [Coriobacteriales bacterium]
MPQAFGNTVATCHSGSLLRHCGVPLRHCGAPLRHSGLDPESIGRLANGT